MMTFRRIIQYVAAEPFRPFRIHMASGETFDVRHPEMVHVGRTTVTVATWMSDDEETSREHERELSIILIESIESLDSPVRQAADDE